ncbi:uncharacterized protein LOC115476295 [Microcaecilia unicolor]|uniref:Uncharacterized protein LOC115476295 n=1 Tax=Microcaecilia unicolor TaxID=1415580 RepID=A0A6P7YYA5_9AMPH|nr:uncharacterized protein LOC115476295 [Microcaecilia unicolor]XP_030068445.1 uncharacterized protein LOC115476295 [Microcaecilia unicolor]XP_030068446.1 uncharacterized protein LOC115476295 [Microcaecilia unicolor]
MPLSGPLYACEDPSVWRAVLDIYWDVIKAKGEKQKKLLALEKWYQEELPATVMGRQEKYLTRDELVKLMEWKLTRGKFRPRLQQMVATNPGETVESCTRRAFKLLPDVEAAITELSQLKAIGPATASAVLAAGAPEEAAFMADEAVESVTDLTPIQYTIKHYSLYLNKIRDCVRKLKKADPGTGWTPHRVEMCLWASAVAQKLCPLLLETLRSDPVKAYYDCDTGACPTKKQKTK